LIDVSFKTGATGTQTNLVDQGPTSAEEKLVLSCAEEPEVTISNAARLTRDYHSPHPNKTFFHTLRCYWMRGRIQIYSRVA
jgi:hypothetical protein